MQKELKNIIRQNFKTSSIQINSLTYIANIINENKELIKEEKDLKLLEKILDSLKFKKVGKSYYIRKI